MNIKSTVSGTIPSPKVRETRRELSFTDLRNASDKYKNSFK